MSGRFADTGGRLARRMRHATDVARHGLRRRSSTPIFSGDLDADAADAMLIACRPALDHVLRDNILTFWDSRIVDEDHGGFRFNHDQRGDWLGPSPKRLITQARGVWFYSRLANSPYAEPAHLDIARHGYTFMITRLWDDEFGGFFWEVDPAGEVTIDEKHVMAQAFGLFALTEYALASEDHRAAARADELFDLVVTNAHDPINGGFREVFAADWAPSDHGVALGRDPRSKTLDTHLHLLEGLTGYCRIASTDEAGALLQELIGIMASVTVDDRVAAGGELYHRDWSPVDSTRGRRVSYGHEAERIWMVADACEAVGIPHDDFVDRYVAVFASLLRYGYDRRGGGIYAAGPLGRVARSRGKLWWAQAEGLVACLVLYALTGDSSYAQCFVHTLGWVVDHQVDWEHGEWHELVSRDGTSKGVKAGPWKSPYHNGRAMLVCLERLDLLGGPPLPLRITR